MNSTPPFPPRPSKSFGPSIGENAETSGKFEITRQGILPEAARSSENLAQETPVAKLPSDFTRRSIRAALVSISVILASGPTMAADQYWKTDGTSGTWTSTSWNIGSANATGGTGWTPGNNAVFTANSTLTFASSNVGNVTLSDGISVVVSQAGTLAAGSHIYDVGSGSTLTWTNQNVSDNSSSSFTKNGIGTWSIGSQGNNYTGGFTLNAGTVSVTGFRAFGIASMTINGGTLQSAGGNSFAVTALTIGGDFTFSGTGNDIWGSTVDVGSTVRTITNSTTGTATRTLSGTVSGAGGLAFTGSGGSGGIVVSGSNDYSGGTTVGGGLVKLSGSGTLGSSSGSLTVNAGLLELNGTSQSVGNLTGSGGSIVNNSASGISTLTIGSGNGTGGSYSGTIANNTTGSSTVALAKTGSGTITLSGTNSYSSGTTVNAGTLVAGSTSALGSGTVLINGGQLKTSVTNVNTGALNLSSGSLQLDGTSAGTVTLASGTTFSMSGGIWSLNLATSLDQILGSGIGTFSITGGTFDLGGGAINYASTYNLLSGFSSGSVSGLGFTGFNSVSYLPSLNTSGVLSFSAIPEPASALVGLVVVAGLSRRNRNGSRRLLEFAPV